MTGRIGVLTRSFHRAPTSRSQHHTVEVDAPELLRQRQKDVAHAAISVRNCVVCHQTCRLVALHLETHASRRGDALR
jgi:hypothetical protein